MPNINELTLFQQIKHLAHVFLDGELGGSPLNEGANVKELISSFRSFFSWIEQSGAEDALISSIATKSLKDKAGDLSNLRKVIEQFEYLDSIATKLTLVTKNHDLEVICDLILKRYTEKGEVFLPGGWSTTNGGHAMTYRIIMDSETKQTTLMVYNTGAGLEFHQQGLHHTGKLGYYPVYAFKFNWSHGNQAKFKVLLIKILGLKVNPQCLFISDERSANGLYEKILDPSINWLGAMLLPTTALPKPILGQRNGVCALKSCEHALRENFDNKSLYRQFLFAYRLFLLKNHIDINAIKVGETLFPGYRKFMMNCLANTSRMLNKDIKKDLSAWTIDESDHINIRIRLESYEKIIKSEKINDKKNKIVRFDIVQNRAKVEDPPGRCFEATEQGSCFDVEEPFGFNEADIAGATAIEALRVVKNKAWKNKDNFTHALEYYCYIFSEENKILFDRSMQADNSIVDDFIFLANELEKISHRLSPHQVCLYAGLLFIFDKFCEDQAVRVGNKTLSSLEIPEYARAMRDFYLTLLANPYMASKQPRLDIVLQRAAVFYGRKAMVRNGSSIDMGNFKIHERIKNREKQILNHYCKIIFQSPPNEIETIKEIWRLKCSNKKALEQDVTNTFVELGLPPSDACCYAVLCNERAENIKELPETKRNLNVQEQLEAFQAMVLGKISQKIMWFSDQKRREEWRSIEMVHYRGNDRSAGRAVLWSFYANMGLYYVPNPGLKSKYAQFEHQGVANALDSQFDGNGFTSKELAFHLQGTAFDQSNYLSQEARLKTSWRYAINYRSKESRRENQLHLFQIDHAGSVQTLLSELLQQYDWLIDRSFQRYIELTIFKPNALLNILANPVGLWELLKELFEKNDFKKDPVCHDKASWFLLCLATDISIYALEAEKYGLIKLSETNKKYCVGWLNKMLEVVAARLGNETSLGAKKGYHLRMLAALSVFPDCSEDQIERLFECLVNYNTMPFSLESVNDLNEVVDDYQREYEEMIIHRATTRLNEALKSKPLRAEYCERMGRHFYELVSPDQATLVLDKSKKMFPYYTFDVGDKKLIIDVASGRMSFNGKEIGYVPQRVMASMEYRYVFGDKPMFAEAESASRYLGDHKRYKIMDGNTEHHIYYLDNQKVIFIDKKINGEWYRLSAPTVSAARHRKMTHSGIVVGINPNYDSPMTQADHWYWVKNKSNYFVESGDTRSIVYMVKDNQIEKYDENGNSWRMVDKPIPDMLLRLESAKFIECLTEHANDRQLCWHLPRYNMKFIEEDKILFSADKRYRLMMPENDTFGAGILLVPQNNDDKTYYLMPKQRGFYSSDRTKDTIRTTITFDLANWIAANQVCNRLMKSDEKSCEGGWLHDGLEEMIDFECVGNELRGRSAADKIYLAYCYLTQHEYRKALISLRDCRYQGTVEEARMLWWIVDKIPEITDSEISPLQHSRLIAIQMRALYGFVLLKDEFKTEIDVILQPKNDTEWFRHKEHLKLKKFYEEFVEFAFEHYSIYDNYRNNIPYDYQLTKSEEDYLLIYFQAEHEKEKEKKLKENKSAESGPGDEMPMYSGVVGQRYLERSGALFLEKPAQTVYEFNQLKRVNFIFSEFIKNKEIDFSYKFNWRVDDNSRETVSKCNEARAKSLASLTPWLSESAMVDNFVNYYWLARNGTSVEVEAIKSFCLTMFMKASYMQNDKNTKENNWIHIYLTWILWAVCCRGKQFFPESFFKPKKGISWESCGSTYYRRASEIIAELLEYAGLVGTDRLPISILKREKSKVALEVSLKARPAAAASRHQLDERKMAPFNVENEKLSKIRKKAGRIKQCYESDAGRQIDLLPDFSGWSLSDQTAELNRIDDALLQSKKLYNKNLSELFDLNQEAITSISVLDDISSQTKRLEEERERSKSEIEKLIAVRCRNVVSEVGKSSKKLNAEFLIENHALHSSQNLMSYGFSENEISKLEGLISDTLLQSQRIFQLSKVKTSIEDYNRKKTAHAKLGVMHALLEEDYATYRHEAVFQYIQKLGLYHNQVRALRTLAENRREDMSDYLIKLIMGGGKTKVILPLLLYVLGNGKNIPIVLVPDASLNTNFTDLRRTSSQSFGQQAALFTFDRYTANDVASLRFIYEKIQIIQSNGQYMVSSPSYFQSLELRYFDLLNHKAEDSEEQISEGQDRIEEMLHWLTLIRRELKNHGVVLIDESHLLLNIRKELNYSIGKNIQLNPEISSTVSSLYSWLNQVTVPLAGIKENEFVDILRSPNKIMNDDLIQGVIDAYADRLFDKKSMPLFVKCCITQILTAELLKKFILSKTSGDEEIVINAILDQYPVIKIRVLILREEFTTLLKMTLRSKIFENYGPATNREGYALAVPYRANNVPTPYVFANFIESSNYTAQMVYNLGVSKEHFVQLLREWKKDACLDRQANPLLLSISERKYNHIFKGEDTSLLNLNVDDVTLIDELHDKYARHGLFIDQVVKEVLGAMTFDEGLLRCDPINLVSMFNRAFGFSATPENHLTYHQKIKIVHETCFMIESQVIDYLKCKETVVVHNDIADPSGFMLSCLNEGSQHSVFLDCGSRFRGMINLDVVKELARHIKKKYILFYQDSGLYAWKVGGPDDQLPIKLSSTDEKIIKNELDDCELDELFTYLDQEHTTGVDIKQAEKASAYVTVDVNTTLSNFLQAVMRMRGLGEEQRVTIVINAELKEILRNLPTNNSELDNLLHHLSCNQMKQLEKDHFYAALKKIRNVFREDLDKRLLDETAPTMRDKYFKQFKQFFIDKQTDDIAQLYENKAKMMATTDILSEYSAELTEKWRSCLESVDVSRAVIDRRNFELQKSIAEIKNQLQPVCEKMQLFPPFIGCKETQQEKKLLKEAEKKQEINVKDETSEAHLDLNEINLSWMENLNENNIADLNEFKSVNRLTENVSYKTTWKFSHNLYATPNLLYAHKNQEANDIYNVYTISPASILFIKEHGMIQAILVSAEEQRELYALLSRPSTKLSEKLWLSSIDGHHFTQVPFLTESEEAKRLELIEQACLFSGRADLLASCQASKWMSKSFDEKFKFLSRIVVPVVGVDEVAFDRLEKRFMDMSKYIREWALHPAPFVSSAELFPDITKEVLQRFEEVKPYLEAVRASSIYKTVDELQSENVLFENALIIEEYQMVNRLLKLLDDKKLEQVASIFEENASKLSLGIMRYWFEGRIVNPCESDLVKIIDALQSVSAKEAWIRQICTAPQCISALSIETLSNYMKYVTYEDFNYYLKHVIHNNEERASLVAAYLLQETITKQDYMSFICELDSFEDGFREICLIKNNLLSAIQHLKDNKINDPDIFYKLREASYMRCIHCLADARVLTKDNINNTKKMELAGLLVSLVVDKSRLAAIFKDEDFSNTILSMSYDILNDEALKKTLQTHFQQENCLIFETRVSNAIATFLSIRETYSKHPEYSKASLVQFTREAICLLVKYNDQGDPPNEVREKNKDKLLYNEISSLAHRHFKHRHLVRRILVDIFLALTVVGFAVFAIKGLTGHGFFFSTARTNREIVFTNALKQAFSPPAIKV